MKDNSTTSQTNYLETNSKGVDINRKVTTDMYQIEKTNNCFKKSIKGVFDGDGGHKKEDNKGGV